MPGEVQRVVRTFIMEAIKMISMIGSGEIKAAPKGANHDGVSLAEELPKRVNEPDGIFSQAKITKSHDFSPLHLDSCCFIRAAAINTPPSWQSSLLGFSRPPGSQTPSSGG